MAKTQTDRLYTPRPSLAVTAYIRLCAAELEAAGRTGTSSKYKSLANHICRSPEGEVWTLRNTGREAISRLADRLAASGMTRNTLSSYMRPLAAILRRAHRERLLEFDPGWFEGIYRGVDKTRKRALTRTEMKRIACLDLNGNPQLRFSRDMFLFSFYAMGMPFVDIAHLGKGSLRGAEIVYRRRKTGQTVVVPLNKGMKAIIGRYSAGESGYLLPLLTGGTKYATVLRLHNRRLKAIGERAGCRHPLASYMARHTWATFARDIGVQLSVISAALGHTSEKTTRIYLDTIDTGALRKAGDKVAALLE